MWNWRNRGEERMDLESGAPEVRELLRDAVSARKEPGTFFAKRVMAAIEAREAELTRRARAWAAIPDFASRLSAIAALLLVIAGTWLLTGNRRPSVSVNGLFEDSAAQAASSSQDDVFTVPVEEAR
ncbi:MAG: hypothetical protein JSS69_10720 [Acidobacteria bacterium]|nr:hypothetical protein [Acidobacteriota bacterium]MBS1866375.1 hypothetical protein [Acidobacteriota bacterium]